MTQAEKGTEAGRGPASPERSAGRAAGYCWARNPNERGLCTRPPHHSGGHKDHYAHTEWWE